MLFGCQNKILHNKKKIGNVYKILIEGKSKNNDLKYYPEFKNIIDNFRCHYKLDTLNYRDLDHFLWIYGKEEQKQNNNN